MTLAVFLAVCFCAVCFVLCALEFVLLAIISGRLRNLTHAHNVLQNEHHSLALRVNSLHNHGGSPRPQ